MKHATRAALALVTIFTMSACKPNEEPTAQVGEVSAPSNTESGSGPLAGNAFDVESVPVSNIALGAFPYITLPAGYSSHSFETETKDFARFPFWVKGEPHWVEGKMYLATFGTEAGKSVSEYEVKRNFEALVQQMGGQKISEEKIPREMIESWGEEITRGFNSGLGDVDNRPATTYLIRRDDGNIWIHLAISGVGSYVVAREKGFEATARLLPAAELKQQIDATGRVALHVNFATDKTEMLPDSLPQIGQVAKLLKDDPQLKLSVHGHTDNSGDAAHNQQLSEGRATAVVAALVAKGVDAARLDAKGFGQQQPVADNATEGGKAENRRVELVRRP